MTTTIAISQSPPALLKLDESIARAITTAKQAAERGAQLLVFPEAFLPGYPTWIWRMKPSGIGGDVHFRDVEAALASHLHAKLRTNAINIRNGALQPLQEVAKSCGMTLVIGFNEIDSEYSGSTIFNSVAVIGADGEVLNVHRKLMPTNPERMVWGMGDANGLRVVDTPVGRIGALICWENYMPLARYALYAQDIEIYVAPTWDYGDIWLASMRHIAREAGCWVLSTATALQGADVPADFPGRSQLFADEEWINPGDAVVIRPDGRVVAGPLHQAKELLVANIDVEAARAARRTLDVTGHYARPDLFRLSVDRAKRAPVDWSS